MQLKKHGIHKLIVIGLIAHTYIEATVMLGYEVTVVKDATADYSDEMMPLFRTMHTSHEAVSQLRAWGMRLANCRKRRQLTVTSAQDVAVLLAHCRRAPSITLVDEIDATIWLVVTIALASFGILMSRGSTNAQRPSDSSTPCYRSRSHWHEGRARTAN